MFLCSGQGFWKLREYKSFGISSIFRPLSSRRYSPKDGRQIKNNNPMMDNNPQEKASPLNEDIQRNNHLTWFGYRRRTILPILTLILVVLTFEASLAVVQVHKFHKCGGSSMHLARDVLDDSLAISSSVNSGQMTYFQPALGACGMQNTGNEMVCAISKGLYGIPPHPLRFLTCILTLIFPCTIYFRWTILLRKYINEVM